jgi:hypothetical protein
LPKTHRGLAGLPGGGEGIVIRFVPWVIGVTVLAVAVGAWLESRERGTLGRFLDRARYGDEGPMERAGRKIDEAIERTKKDLRDD